MNIHRKPPIGPVPEWLWREQRMWHLIERLAGFANQTEAEPHIEWLYELRQRIDDVLERENTPLQP